MRETCEESPRHRPCVGGLTAFALRRTSLEIIAAVVQKPLNPWGKPSGVACFGPSRVLADEFPCEQEPRMSDSIYRGAIIGLGFIGGADQVSGDALGQRVEDLDGTHFDAMRNHPRVTLMAGSSRDAGRRKRFAQRTA